MRISNMNLVSETSAQNKTGEPFRILRVIMLMNICMKYKTPSGYIIFRTFLTLIFFELKIKALCCGFLEASSEKKTDRPIMIVLIMMT